MVQEYGLWRFSYLLRSVIGKALPYNVATCFWQEFFLPGSSESF
jgi:hypothetical protein